MEEMIAAHVASRQATVTMTCIVMIHAAGR